MKKFLDKIKKTLYKIYQKSYGMDDLNKILFVSSFVLSVVQLIIRNNIVSLISIILMIIFLFRYFSTKKFARSEENRKFRKLIKYFKMKWQYRKTHRIFMCKNCGQLIRVPKGHGKIETTCPNCGAKETHKS